MVPGRRVTYEENSCDVRTVPAGCSNRVSCVGSGNYSPSNSSVEQNVGAFIADGSPRPPHPQLSLPTAARAHRILRLSL